MKRLLPLFALVFLSGCAASGAGLVTVNVAINASTITGPEIVGAITGGTAIGIAGYEFISHETGKAVRREWDADIDGHGQGGWLEVPLE